MIFEILALAFAVGTPVAYVTSEDPQKEDTKEPTGDKTSEPQRAQAALPASAIAARKESAAGLRAIADHMDTGTMLPNTVVAHVDRDLARARAVCQPASKN